MNTKISEVKNKIPNTSDLATVTVSSSKVSEVENKTPNHDKYITTSEFNKLTVENFIARLKQASLVTKSDFDKSLKKFTIKITSNKTKYLEFQKTLNSVKTNDNNFF